MAPWLAALVQAERDNQPSVLVTVLDAKGSTPREAGAKMVVSVDGTAGTIGGGNLEHQCEAMARAILGTDATTPTTRDFPLGPTLGQCCGGHVTVLFEPMRPPALQVALFGAGHVGKALVKILGDLPCRVRWIDARPEAIPASLPANVTPMRPAHPVQVVEGLPTSGIVLVMTHDHQLDFEIVAASLRRDDLRMVGLIGSATKRARFAARLARQGMAAAVIDKLICPIGLGSINSEGGDKVGSDGTGINGKQPAVVAVSVAAQILQLQSQPLQSQPERPTRMPEMTRSCGDCVCPPVRR